MRSFFDALLLTVLCVAAPDARAVVGPAQPKASCEGPLKAAEANPAPNPMVYAERAGTLYEPGTTVWSDLPSGEYRYLMTEKGELVFSRIVKGKNLVGVKSLAREYRNAKGVAPQIKAAGRLWIAFGLVVRIDNVSDVADASAASLNFAVKQLSNFAFPQSSRMKALDYGGGHAPAATGLIALDEGGLRLKHGLEAELTATSQGQRWIALYNKFGRALLAATGAPSPEDVERVIANLAMTEAERLDLERALGPFKTAMTTDGMHLGLWAILKNSDIDLGEATQPLGQTARLAFPAAPPDALERLKDLESRFAEMTSK